MQENMANQRTPLETLCSKGVLWLNVLLKQYLQYKTTIYAQKINLKSPIIDLDSFKERSHYT